MPSDKPQDVYNRVLENVVRKIKTDVELYEQYLAHMKENKPFEISQQQITRGKAARMVQSIISRKVIKQTVMTSVYGVTKVGAREQIQNRLSEVFSRDKVMLSAEEEQEIYKASMYLANLTLTSLEEMFDSAKKIMDWLGNVAKMVAVEVSVTAISALHQLTSMLIT